MGTLNSQKVFIFAKFCDFIFLRNPTKTKVYKIWDMWITFFASFCSAHTYLIISIYISPLLQKQRQWKFVRDTCIFTSSSLCKINLNALSRPIGSGWQNLPIRKSRALWENGPSRTSARSRRCVARPRIGDIPQETRILRAASQYSNGKFKSILAAAGAWSIPYFALRSRLQGHQPRSKNHGGKPLLDEVEQGGFQ